MDLSQTVGLDRNTLPYFVFDKIQGSDAAVRFAPFTVSDQTELSGPSWASSLFSQTWAGFAGDSQTLKLVKINDKVNDKGQDIDGIVRLGAVPLGSRGLRNSLLEAAPVHRFAPHSGRQLSGVGRVLLARLVVECYHSGGSGALFVRAHAGAVDFYKAMGCRQLKNSTEFLLPSSSAEALFAAATH